MLRVMKYIVCGLYLAGLWFVNQVFQLGLIYEKLSKETEDFPAAMKELDQLPWVSSLFLFIYIFMGLSLLFLLPKKGANRRH